MTYKCPTCYIKWIQIYHYIGSKTYYTVPIDTFISLVEPQCKPDYLTKEAWKSIPTNMGFSISPNFSHQNIIYVKVDG